MEGRREGGRERGREEKRGIVMEGEMEAEGRGGKGGRKRKSEGRQG